MLPGAFNLSDKNLLLRHGITDLLQLAQRRGANLHKLLHGTQIFEQDLSLAESRCHHRDWLTLVARSQQLASPELPFILADSLLHNKHSSLCQSLPLAANLATSLRQLYYFRHQLLPGLFVLLRKTDSHLSIVLKPAVQLGAQQAFIIKLAMAFLVRLVQLGTQSADALNIQLKQTAPAHLAHFNSHWPCPVRFSQPLDALHIPLSLWYQPFITRQAAGFRDLSRACYQLNRRLPPQRGLFELIQRQLYRALPQQASLDQLASYLGLSSSSLKRLLQQQDTHFAALADDLRCDLANLLLLQSRLSNRQLASELGYSDEHNFRRAFKRWTGHVPSSVRLW